MNLKPSYLYHIDGLRAVAVLSVVLFHLELSFIPGGFLGVDIFFVISGYLISRQIIGEFERTGGFSISQFYIRRFRRIAPALIIVLLLSCIAASIVFSPIDLQKFGGNLLASVFSFSNVFYWFNSGYFSSDAELNPLLHTWSLSVEEQFYIFWPIGLIFWMRMKRASIGIILALIAFSLLANLAVGNSDIYTFLGFETYLGQLNERGAALFFLTPFRIYELLIGAAAVVFEKKDLLKLSVRRIVGIVGALAIVLPFFIFDEHMLIPYFWAIIPCVGTAALILYGNLGFIGRILSNGPAVFIGKISYSLYLVHWPLIVFYRYLILETLQVHEQAILFASSIIIAYLLYRFIEMPFRRGFSGKGPVSFKSMSIIGIPIIAAFVILGSITVTNLYQWRELSDEKKALLADITSPKDFHKKYYGGQNCIFKVNEYNVKLGCQVNAENEQNVFLLGDSHALQYTYGFSQVFPNIGLTHFNNRCRFNSLHTCYGDSYDDFAKLREDQMKFVLESMDIVIIAQSWLNSRNGAYDPREQKDRVFKGNKAYVNYLIEELQEVQKVFGPDRLVIIGEINRFGKFGDPLTCFTSPYPSNNCLVGKPNRAVSFNAEFGDQLKKLGIAFINPTDVLCDTKECANFTDTGKPIYSDNNHLSKWGSELVLQKNQNILNLQISD